jgi:hypothetical protein
MEINPSTAANVLTDLVREDRNEARIWRTRLENLASSTLLASFAISAFFLGKATQPNALQLRTITLLVDGCLILVTAVFFLRVRRDLIALRKAQGYRQKLLIQAVKGELQRFEPFLYPPETPPTIDDIDVDWLYGLSLAVMLAKTIAVAVFPTYFLIAASQIHDVH